MNQKIWSGLTTAALILTTVGNAASSYAGEPTASDDLSNTNVSSELDESEPTTFSLAVSSPTASPEPVSVESASAPVSPETEIPQVATTLPTTTADTGSSNEVAKVGEYQSQEESEPEAIAEIQTHPMNGRQAATLYVQSIPVLTFLGATTSSSAADSIDPALADSNATGLEVKVGTTQADEAAEMPAVQQLEAAPASAQDETDPTWRASALAAQINQLYLNNFDASAITVRWNSDRERYIIEVNGEELVEMNPDTILPDSTSDPAEDALQATNRLRRLLGNADPLRDIVGRPQPESRAPHLSFSTTRQFTGVASWYGPGFHGNRSASGEVFNQNALTAAHRSLPFGTQVRVTNLHTGQSVVVRITDRGPFSRGRIIDLSAGAAQVIGLIRSGVAPVRLDVLGTATASN